MIRVSVIEIPPAPSGAVSLTAGHPVDEFVPGLDDGETVLALAPLDGSESGGVALGTASGTVKRVLPEYPANRDEFELITLKDGDRVIGAAYLVGDDAELVFVTSDAQLLRFPASAVRPQGRAAGGMAGIRLSDGATAIWFGALGPAAAASGSGSGSGSGDGPVVVTVAGRSGALPGTGGASVKVTPFAEYPPKGRATGGVRCQRFLKGEDGLIQAWIGPPPVLAATESGVMVDLSDMQGRRDGSGTALTRQLAYLGPAYRTP
jgi:DNA gyrase subunit A